MNFTTKTHAKAKTGISYLGSVNLSTKHKKAYDYKELTYGLYLAPAKMSGYEVCPMRTKECTSLCLNGSGHSLAYGDMINGSRIRKTKLFFEHREFFVRWMIAEIITARDKAKRLGYRFSVRLNNTSDIPPTSFYITEGGKSVNILELFPDVQFYDYTKVPNRTTLSSKYPNYDITFSYSGLNMETCEEMLKNKVRVAMVFKKVPETFMGYKVVNGDNYDMRYLDPKNVIVGLKFKVVKNRVSKNSKFVIS